MSQIIVLASGKGGTGKTTVTVNLAVALCNKGKKVLLIDCDCGMRGLDLMLGLDKNLVYDTSDVIAGNCFTEDAMNRLMVCICYRHQSTQMMRFHHRL